MAVAETSKERLLQAAVEYMAAHGVADVSLRRLADAIGTSHRMLIYHFGSKEGLLIEVIRAVESQQRARLADLSIDPSLDPAELARRMWRHLADPALWPNERLFFETYGQALQERPHTAEFLDGIVDSWLEPVATLRGAQGVPPGRTRAQARLDLAVTRGLLLDLLATKDRTGVDDAFEQYVALFQAWNPQPPAPEHDTTASTAAQPTTSCTTIARRVRILLVSGSLRHASTNTAVMRTAEALVPDLITVVRYDQLAQLPAFNPDDDIPPLPTAVEELRAQIHDADAVLFSVPEYAGGLPGSFKNLLDWTIGDDRPRSIYDKPVAWINTSTRSAADAHRSLQTVLAYAHATIVEAACAHISVPTALVGDDGLINDVGTRDAILNSLTQLAVFAARNSGIRDQREHE